MIAITSNRIRSIIAECHTEMDVAKTLRYHKVKYSFSTDGGTLAVMVPCRKGMIRIYRTCSRSVRFMVQHKATGRTIYPVIPVLHPDT